MTILSLTNSCISGLIDTSGIFSTYQLGDTRYRSHFIVMLFSPDFIGSLSLTCSTDGGYTFQTKERTSLLPSITPAQRAGLVSGTFEQGILATDLFRLEAQITIGSVSYSIACGTPAQPYQLPPKSLNNNPVPQGYVYTRTGDNQITVQAA